jgi:hypothetical protein
MIACLIICNLLLIFGFSPTLAKTSIEAKTNCSLSRANCYWDTFSFGVDDWIISAPTNSILATFDWNGTTYPAFVATEYGSGKAIYTPGSTFSEIQNNADPHNVRHELFLNSVLWVTDDQLPSQTTVLVTYGHRELVTYHWENNTCCKSNIVQALQEKGYTVDVSFDIPHSLTGYDAVIMPGVGFAGSPFYPNPMYWCEPYCHAPTVDEINTLLSFIQNGGGLVTSIESGSGAAWMSPISSPMNVVIQQISPDDILAHRIINHPIFLKECMGIYLPLVLR